MKLIFNACLLCLSTVTNYIAAQEISDRESYQLLLLEMQVIYHYDSFKSQTNSMMDSAKTYAENGDYELALAFLEEAREGLPVPEQKSEQQIYSESDFRPFSFNIISGIDYSKQEFELGLDQSDSTLLDEISKPFIGFNLKYFFNKNAQITNQLKYDREYFFNELNFEIEKNLEQAELLINPGHIFSFNNVYDGLSFSEIFLDLNLKSNRQNSQWYWSVQNLSRYKKYSNPDKTIPDFFRNLTKIYINYDQGFYKSLQFDYNLDYNESINFDNNDFIEQSGGIGYQSNFFNNLKYKFSAHYRYSRFNYLISDETSDSLFSNISQNYTFEHDLKYNLIPLIDLNLDGEFSAKSYRKKTEQEPDYQFIRLNPFVTFNMSEKTLLRAGYIFENKSHQTDGLTAKEYVNDQDYYSNGFSAGFDYSDLADFYISFNVEYMQRRYPTNENVDFSIYSNRNILNIMLFAQLPLSEKISLNAIASYDNDKDVDLDYNDIISSFFTLELSYSL
ncbi:MAG: hypothetical protein H6627_06650 [Calditrichae bacterium]|nr:hypothetical protein [Calditrichia bacterium]